MTKIQKEILMKSFRSNPHPSKEEQSQLAMSLNTSQKVIRNWFGNRRKRKENKKVPKGSE